MRIGLIGVLVTAAALAQKPAIAPQGVVNAASLADGAQFPLGAGSLASIFGSGLAAETAVADSFPLPRRLAGVSVLFDGIPMPLLMVSPTQVNFQVSRAFISPYTGGMGPNAPVTIVVRSPGGTSNTAPARVYAAGPGVFTQDGSGCGQALAFIERPGGLLEPNTPQNSASPGDALITYATGMGYSYQSPPDGEPQGPWMNGLAYGASPSMPVPLGMAQPALALDGPYPFSGFRGVIGAIDVWRVRFKLLPGVAQGCAVPLRMLDPPVASRPVAISVRQGGGACVDPPPDRYARFRWVHRIEANDPKAPPQDRLEVEFVQASGTFGDLGFMALNGSSCACAGRQPIADQPSCPGVEAFVPRAFDAGTLSLNGPALNLVIPKPADLAATNAYSLSIPPGSIGPGDYLIEGAGGSEVGAFRSPIRIGSPIEVTTGWTPDTKLDWTNGLKTTWTGGQPDTQVRVRVSGSYTHGYVQDAYCECVAPASAGSVVLQRFPGYYYNHQWHEGDPPISPVREITVSVGAANPTKFEAPGLTLGGQQNWTYEFHYRFNTP